MYVLSQNTQAIKGEAGQKTCFYLQRYNSQWEKYINLDSIEDVIDGDKLIMAKSQARFCPNLQIYLVLHEPADLSANISVAIATLL